MKIAADMLRDDGNAVRLRVECAKEVVVADLRDRALGELLLLAERGEGISGVGDSGSYPPDLARATRIVRVTDVAIGRVCNRSACTRPIMRPVQLCGFQSIAVRHPVTFG